MLAKGAFTLARLVTRLEERGVRVVAAVEQTTDQFADFLVTRAVANAPQQTGELASSIRKEVEPPRAGVVRRDVVASAPHAMAVHERPPHMDGAHEAETTPEGFPGRAYLTRPLRFHRAAFGQAVNAAAQAALRQVIR